MRLPFYYFQVAKSFRPNNYFKHFIFNRLTLILPNGVLRTPLIDFNFMLAVGPINLVEKGCLFRI